MNSSIKSLFGLFQKTDYRDKDNSGKKKLIGILTAYLFSGCMLSFNFYSFFDERSFIILTLSASLFYVSMLVLNDFNGLFLALRNFDLLNSLPINSRDVFVSKFLSAAVYLLLFIIASLIPQAVFYQFYNHDIMKTALYIIVCIVFSLTATGFLSLIYTLLLYYFTKKAVLLLNIIQVIFFIFIFYSSTISSRFPAFNKTGMTKINIDKIDFVKYLPQTFFAKAVSDISILIICLLITATVVSSLYFLLSKNYFRLLEKARSLDKRDNSNRTGKKRKVKLYFLQEYAKKFILKNNIETASYELAKHQIKNSRFLRMKYIPIALMPLMMVSVGVLSDLNSILFFDNKDGGIWNMDISIPVISPVISMIVLMSARMMISGTKISDDNSNDTYWIYGTIPFDDSRSIINGVNKFVFMNMIFPVMFLIFILLSFKADILYVLLNVTFIFSMLYFLNSLFIIPDKTLPFTLESSKFNSVTRIFEIIVTMFSGIVLFLIQIFVFQNIIFVIISILVLNTVSLLLNRK